ncbi:hypothetical protein ASG40_13390 [Methylobacterium sp. Leaf399]|nr:hypothetical protein ASG40_13390 [Methylobacterium sp. Leaf399]
MVDAAIGAPSLHRCDPEGPARAAASAIGGIAAPAGAPDRGWAAAAARPPRTMAPSLPMITRPIRAGRATHRAATRIGAARCRLFWKAKGEPRPLR